MSCSACRTEVSFGAKHWVCSVSTCNRERTRLVFCSVSCWDSHVATLRHRDAWAVEAVAPTRAEWDAEQSAQAAAYAARPLRAASPPDGDGNGGGEGSSGAGREVPLAESDGGDVLVVVSKMKKFIKERGGMNTSEAVARLISDHVRALCEAAIQSAKNDGRKTVLDRDVPPIQK
jgi:hypothetical protein